MGNGYNDGESVYIWLRAAVFILVIFQCMAEYTVLLALSTNFACLFLYYYS